ncbi:MAG: integrase core domain-containing protein [Candidatus Paceibacterota bacterium]
MRQFNKLKDTKGFITIWERVIRFKYMITEEAKERCRILAFWERHGDEATTEAFKVSRATLFRWQQALQKGDGKLEALNKKSTAPKNKRKRVIPKVVEDFILKEREFDPHLSKDKLSVLMMEDKVANLSPSTVGRMLDDLKKDRKLSQTTKLSYHAKTDTFHVKLKIKRKKLRSKGHEGGLVKADSIVRFHNGVRRYILTAIDKEAKFAFALAYKNHSSDGATDFMQKFKYVAPVSLTHVQTDNGSEFAKHFDIFLEKNNIVHFHTYPRCPKQNSEIERFNRTISEAFISRNLYLLAYDIDAFNVKLMEWLLWYNTRRPHWSLGLISPLRYIVSTLSAEKSQMCWTNTHT